MFKFAEPTYLFFLLVIPALILLFVVSNIRSRRKMKKFGNPALLQELMPNVSKFRPTIKFYLQLAALTFIIIVLARPQFGTTNTTIKKNGISMMIALDVSNSMLCEDVKPNRMEKAKQIVSQLIDNMEDDRIGMVIFAASPFVQLPITADQASAKMFLSTIYPGMVSPQGTAIGAAIDLSMRSFGEKGDEAQAIVIITDGENHEDDAVAVAKRARENGLFVYVIGVGTPEGAPIPQAETNDFIKDKDGNIVVTKLNEAKCQEIAAAGKGIYVLADNTNHAQRIITKELHKLSKAEVETTVFVDQNEQFQSFAFFALFLLIIDFFILNRRNKRLAKINFFDLKDPKKNK